MPRSKPVEQVPGADEGRLLFELLNEVGIIAQLSRTLLESHLDKGLTVHHFTALNHLVRLGDGKTPKAMAQAFQVPKTSMSHTLAGLEKRQWIQMTPDPADGRGKLVYITAEGAASRERFIAAMQPALQELLPLIDSETLTQLLPGLRHLRSVLDQARD